MDFSGFNWGEVVLAAILAFGFGAIWYGPLFGQRWRRLNNTSSEGSTPIKFGVMLLVAFVLYFFVALMMSFFIEIAMMLGSGAMQGAMFGGFLALIFVAPCFAVNYLFANRPLALYAIDAGFVLIQFAIMGAVMGAWV